MPEYLHALPSGYQLHEYKIESVVGSGGFGITYKARDINLDKPVAIKEYFPVDYAWREGQTAVKPKSSSHQDDYDWGLKRFLDEARTLARFNHPHLNKVYRLLEANGTAYMVLEYIAGDTLSYILKEKGQLNEIGLRRMLDELLDGLNTVHAASYIHRDIKPTNIIFRADGSAILLDFGAARQAIGQRSQSITSILTPGYAPIEQYDQHSNDTGPWSDLYALGIVAYRCLRGDSESILIDAVARARLLQKGETEKDMPAAEVIGRGNYSPTLLAAIDWAIQVNENERPQSVVQMQAALADQTATTSKVPPEAKRQAEAERIAEEQRKADERAEAKRIAEANRKAEVERIAEEQRKADERAEAKRIAEANRKAEVDPEFQKEKSSFYDLVGEYPQARRIYPSGATDLHIAAAHGWIKLMQCLIDNGAKVDAQLKSDGEEMTSTLRKRLGLSVGWIRNGQQSLHLAASKGHNKVVELLLNLGADVNAENNGGNTPLHRVARDGHSEMVELLLNLGADVNAKNNYGWTPLHRVARDGHSEMVELLLNLGADVNAKNNYGWTPLHRAAQEGHSEVVESLLKQTADVDAKDNDGETPLHRAAYDGHSEMVELLLKQGADVNAENNDGYTPLDDAIRWGKYKAAEVLRDNGGQCNKRC